MSLSLVVRNTSFSSEMAEKWIYVEYTYMLVRQQQCYILALQLENPFAAFETYWHVLKQHITAHRLQHHILVPTLTAAFSAKMLSACLCLFALLSCKQRKIRKQLSLDAPNVYSSPLQTLFFWYILCKIMLLLTLGRPCGQSSWSVYYLVWPINSSWLPFARMQQQLS